MYSLVLNTNSNDIDIVNKSNKDIYTHNNQPLSYENMIIKKPWGYEFIFYNHSLISGWVLYMNTSCKTSLHFHKDKDTPMIILKGHVILHTIDSKHYLYAGDSIFIGKGKIHSIEAINDSIICEFEIHPNKTDLYRINDYYGREKEGYEGINKMVKVDNTYNYFNLNNNAKYIHNNFSLFLNQLYTYDNKQYKTMYLLLDRCAPNNIIGTLIDVCPDLLTTKFLQITVLI